MDATRDATPATIVVALVSFDPVPPPFQLASFILEPVRGELSVDDALFSKSQEYTPRFLAAGEIYRNRTSISRVLKSAVVSW